MAELSAEELKEIHARISATMAPTFSSEHGDVGTQGRLHIEDWAALDFHIQALTSRAEKAEGARDEAVENARGWHSVVQAVSTVLELPEPEGATAAANIIAAFDAQKAEADRMRGALEPFHDYAMVSVNADGWINRAGNERISDWFGPSDFFRAYQVYTAALSHQADDAKTVARSGDFDLVAHIDDVREAFATIADDEAADAGDEARQCQSTPLEPADTQGGKIAAACRSVAQRIAARIRSADLTEIASPGHQADDAGAVTGSEERLREALDKLHHACEPFAREVACWAPDFPPSGLPLGDHDPPLSVTWGDLLQLDLTLLEYRDVLRPEQQGGK